MPQGGVAFVNGTVYADDDYEHGSADDGTPLKAQVQVDIKVFTYLPFLGLGRSREDLLVVKCEEKRS
jgi:hypothetical protein